MMFALINVTRSCYSVILIYSLGFKKKKEAPASSLRLCLNSGFILGFLEENMWNPDE